MNNISTVIKLQPIIDHELYNNFDFKITEYIGLNFDPKHIYLLYYDI